MSLLRTQRHLGSLDYRIIAICCCCSCRDASLLVSAALLLLLALGVGALGLIPVSLPGPAQPLELALLLQDAAAADASGGLSC
jgi:hypothetical protein